MSERIVNSNSLWLVFANDGGYEAYIVTGWEAMEKKWLELHFGPEQKPPDWTTHEMIMRNKLLTHLRDENNWFSNYKYGRVSYSINHEDGSAGVFLITHPGDSHAQHQAP